MVDAENVSNLLTSHRITLQLHKSRVSHEFEQYYTSLSYPREHESILISIRSNYCAWYSGSEQMWCVGSIRNSNFERQYILYHRAISLRVLELFFYFIQRLGTHIVIKCYKIILMI